MPDREKVIKGLECCVIYINCSTNGGCPYKQSGGACLNVAIKDALTLLKAQEPVEPKKKSFLVSGPDDYTSTPDMTVCGACGAWLLTVAPRAKYCPQCGRAVKWE